MNYEKATALLEQHLRIYYSIGIGDVEITETKGYTKQQSAVSAGLTVEK